MMTWQDPPPLEPTAKKAGKLITPEQLAKSGSEDSEQMALFAQAALHVKQYPQLRWLYAIPNGGFRHIAEAAKFVATGTRAGVPDICLPCIGRGIPYAGLYIELKIEKRRKEKNGGCSQEQLDYLEYLSDEGYYCKVCYGWKDAWKTIVDYLEGRC